MKYGIHRRPCRRGRAGSLLFPRRDRHLHAGGFDQRIGATDQILARGSGGRVLFRLAALRIRFRAAHDCTQIRGWRFADFELLDQLWQRLDGVAHYAHHAPAYA